MKILIATDSFKDALPAMEACQAIERGLQAANPSFETVLFPLADGGEGTAKILTYHTQGERVTTQVLDPLFRKMEASYGISADGRTAFIDMAEAAGLQLLQPDERNPLLTSTYGVGEMIRDAVERGTKKILLGIGGSATNDAGIGMAHALGFSFLDANGKELNKESMTGKNLTRIQRINTSTSLPFNRLNVQVLCDVSNPLFGERGAAHVYAPQKGADADAVAELDAGLKHFAKVLEQHFGRDFSAVPGAGAAGGMGAGALAFLDARLKPGIQTILEWTHFDKKLQDIDLIITGEGKIDHQTLHGKLIKGITECAGEYHIPVVALCGTLLATPAEVEALGLRAAFSILNRPMELAEALQNTATLLEQTAWHLSKTFLANY